MTDEVSEQMRLAVLFYFTGSFLGIILTILLYGTNILGNFTEKYDITISGYGVSQVSMACKEDYLAAPLAYRVISDNLDLFDEVQISLTGYSFTYNRNTTNLSGVEKLYTTYSTRMVSMEVSENTTTGLLKLKVIEVVK